MWVSGFKDRDIYFFKKSKRICAGKGVAGDMSEVAIWDQFMEESLEGQAKAEGSRSSSFLLYPESFQVEKVE